MKKINVIEGKEMKRSIITIVSVLLMVIAYGCSSGGGGNSNNSTPPLVPQGGKVTRDTLVSYIRHYGKLNVLKNLAGIRSLYSDIFLKESILAPVPREESINL